jgi:hypothetical protein
MQMKYFNIIVIILLSSFTLTICGQSHYLLSSFQAEKSGNRVILNWSIKQGSSCIGINILRSNDTINFKEIGNIQGICGSTEFEQRFSFVDDKPLPNQTNYYKLELGFSGQTNPPLAVECISLGEQKTKVVPNPNNGFGSIYFENPNNESVQILIHDSHGRYVDSYQSQSNQIYFDLTPDVNSLIGFNCNDNFYNYTILSENNQKISTGRMVIIKTK